MNLDVADRMLVDGDVRVRLTPKETEVMHALSRGGYVPLSRLVFVIYGDRDTENPEICIQIVICRLRKKLAIAGWHGLIVNGYGQYTLDRPVKAIADIEPIVIPAEFRRTLTRLLDSHPDHAAADRVLASFVGG